MKNLRRSFERFCFKHHRKGIPNLMLYITLGTALVYVMGELQGNYTFYQWFSFNRELILQGQIWRLISYPLIYSAGDIVMTAISLLCYYSLGRAMENVWGTLRFNLFYFTGIVLMDIYGLLFPGPLGVTYVSASYLNLSLFLGYATLYPDSYFRLFFIIPVRAWIFALVDLGFTFYDVIILSIPQFLFPYNLFPLVALANYFLFFGKDIVNVFPLSWRANASRLFRKKKKYAPETNRKPIQFPSAGSYEASTATVKQPYTHRCTVCGRTDVTNPELEFRYCSRCNGYHCYCEDHISNHAHIE